MFRDILDRLGAGITGKRRERGPSVVPEAKEAVTPFASQPDITVDDTFAALSRELSGLSKVQASQAAKERGWASLQRELERRPVRAAASVAKGTGARGVATAGARPGTMQPRHLRWALASAAAVVVVVAVLLGTYSGGLLQTAEVDPITGTSVVTSDTPAPDTTAGTVPVTSLPETTVTTEAPTTTEDSQPETTVETTTPSTHGGGTEGTTAPTTSGGSGGSDTTTRPPTQTTQPPRTTTTGDTQNAAAQREGSAKTAAAYLANLVVSGDTSGARGLVASEAQTSLAQMVMSLDEPFGYRIPASGITSLDAKTVRVTLEIDDRVLSVDGELLEMVKTYFIRVRVDEGSALITAINAGPQRGP